MFFNAPRLRVYLRCTRGRDNLQSMRSDPSSQNRIRIRCAITSDGGGGTTEKCCSIAVVGPGISSTSKAHNVSR
jgi:hypothetical protein